MLNRINRVKKNKEFNYIYKKGEFYNCKYFMVHYVNTRLPNIKVGFSINKKLGNSVVRSKYKRIMSEIVRIKLPIMSLKNYVITLKPDIVNADYNILVKEFDKFLIKCNLIKDTKDV